MSKLMPVTDLTDHLRVVGKFVSAHLLDLQAPPVTPVYDPEADIALLLRLNQEQETAKANRKPATREANRAMHSGMTGVKSSRRIAEGFYMNGLIHLVDALPSIPKRASFEVKKDLLERVVGYFQKHTEVPGIDLAMLSAKRDEVLTRHQAMEDARAAAKTATEALVAAKKRALEKAVGWCEVFQGFAKITDNAKLLESIPTLPTAHHRRQAAVEPNNPPVVNPVVK